jgi:RNA polymerase sigma factor for flagellar operon FliA
MTPVWRAYKQTGDLRLRNQLVEQYLYLVKVIGNRIAARLPRSIDVQDLRSAGVFGLMRAIENFDLERGTPFESYCATRVRNRSSLYNDALATLRSQLGRDPDLQEIADRLDLTLPEAAKLQRESNLVSVFNLSPQDEREDDSHVLRRLDILMDKDSEVPFERMVAHDLARALEGVLVGPERTVIALYYHESLTMKEIGRVMGISESRVCQIHTKTLKKLKRIIDEITNATRRRLAMAV